MRLVQIRKKTRKPTVFSFKLTESIVVRAVLVIIFHLVKRHHLRNILEATNMVMHDVDHDPDVHGVGFLYQPYKSLFAAKSGLDLF